MKRACLGLLIVLSVLIAGCGEKKVENEGPFVGGANGVTISFVNGAPIAEFAQGREVPVKVLLKNNGEYDVAGNLAEVQLYGLPLEEYGLSGDYKKVSESIRGIKKGLLEEGGEQNVDMGILKYSRAVSGFTDKTLFARVCYPYQTRAIVTSCATSKDIKVVEQNPVCDIEGDKLVQGSVSSGPAQITSFSEQLVGANSVSFKIVVADSGTGDAYAYDSVCSNLGDPVVLAAKKGLVKVTVLPADIECNFLDGESNVGFLKVEDTPRTLICTMDVEGSSSYERDVEIYLDYKYLESASVQMKILEA